MEYALAYAAIGWHVFPIERGTKRPIGRLTPNGHLQATTDPEVIRNWWAQVPDAGIGIAVRASRLVVVDVDPRNGGHFDLERIETERGKLATDVEAFTGGGGQHLVFLAPAEVGNLPGKLARGIDLKSDGYIVVEPSLHPSGNSYEWEASSSPLDGCVPSPLPGWIADMARPGLPAAPSLLMEAPAGARALDAVELADIRAALAMIPAAERDTWLHVGMALHKDVPGALGFDLWCTWSKTCPEKFDPQDQARVWRSFTRKPMGQAVQLGTVFDLAYKHGFSRPKPAAAAAPAEPVLAPDPRTANTVPELVPGPQVAALPMPVQGLNDLARWVWESTPNAHPLLAQATALALACTVAGRRYVSELGDPAHVFFGLMTPTSSQARPMMTAAESVLIDIGLRKMVRSQRLSSAQQVYAAFVRAPSVLYAADDWSEQLQQAKRQPSGLLSIAHGVLAGRVHAGRDIVLDNWGELGMKRPDAAGGQEMPTLYRPALTLLASIAEPQMRAVFKRQELARGALDCMVFVPAIDLQGWSDRSAAAPQPVPAHVQDALKAMAGADMLGDVMSLDSILLHPTPTLVRFACDVASSESRWIEHARRQPAHLRPLSWAARATVRRLCVAMAAFANPHQPVVREDMLAWAERFVRECLDAMLAEMELLSDEDDAKPDASDFLLQALVRQGRDGLPKNKLMTVCKPFRRLSQDEREALLSRMLEDDLITEIPIANGRGRLIVARQFVAERPAESQPPKAPQ
jgi:hypothetical protein